MNSRIALLLLACCGAIEGTTYTCSPPPGTPLCQFPAKIDITFVGTALATNYNANPTEDGLSFADTWYRFKVEEALTGLEADEKEIVVFLNLGGGSVELGRRFFVHATRSRGLIRLASCGNTRPVEGARGDIEYLRSRASGLFRPYIAGSVLRHYRGSPYAVEDSLRGPPRGLPGAHVQIAHQERSHSLATDEHGHFRVENAAPGRYRLTASANGYSLEKSLTLDVPTNGCGIAHIGMFTDASIAGVVRRADGSPAAGVELDLVDENPEYTSITSSTEMITTGPDGGFSAERLPSGRFLLGVNIEESTRYPDQTPPVFFPGAASRSSAQVIELGPNERKTGLVVTLPPPRPFRTVRVRLRWPDGTVPTSGAIDAWVNRGIYVSKYELREGVFQLQLLQGVDYWITAAALDESRKRTRISRGTWYMRKTTSYRRGKNLPRSR